MKTLKVSLAFGVVLFATAVWVYHELNKPVPWRIYDGGGDDEPKSFIDPAWIDPPFDLDLYDYELEDAA